MSGYHEVKEVNREECNLLLERGWEIISTHTVEYDVYCGPTSGTRRQSRVIYVMGCPR